MKFECQNEAWLIKILRLLQCDIIYKLIII